MSRCSRCGSSNVTRTYTVLSKTGSRTTVENNDKYSTLCNDCGNVEQTTKVVSVNKLPLYQDASLLEDLDIVVTSTEEGKSWRFPLNRILAGGDIDKLRYSLDKKTSDISVPTNQVIPVYIPGVNVPVEKAQAVEGKQAQFLAISNDPNDAESLIIQNSGFVTFPRLHSYQVGRTYYLSQTNAGEVVSEKPKSGIVQPLFTVVDELTISINMGA